MQILITRLLPSTQRCISHDPKWTAPETGYIKLNCDAALHSSFSYISVIVRDWEGNLILAATKKYNSNAPEIEAYAMRWALILAKEQGFSKVILEVDSKACLDPLS